MIKIYNLFMKILITPEDIVKRCCWDGYVYYILGSDKDAQEILEKNEEFEMCEKDALVIGLLRVIETNNLIHKFNTFITELLTNKSIKNDGKLLIRINVVETAVDDFMKKFPEYWNPSKYWTIPLGELREYVNEFKEQITTFEKVILTEQHYTSELYLSKDVKKLLKFQY